LLLHGIMANDTTIKSLFDHTKLPRRNVGDVTADYPCVYITWVEVFANFHPSTDPESADLVRYANGPTTLSPDGTKLLFESKLWRNLYYPGFLGFGTPAVPPDAFNDEASELTVAITVNSLGQATYQGKLRGVPIGGMPPVSLEATYNGGLVVETKPGSMRCLAFTLGWLRGNVG
jgi:hypothetical protein